MLKTRPRCPLLLPLQRCTPLAGEGSQGRSRSGSPRQLTGRVAGTRYASPYQLGRRPGSGSSTPRDGSPGQALGKRAAGGSLQSPKTRLFASPAQQRLQPAAVAPPALVLPPPGHLDAAAPSQLHGGAVGPSSQGQGSNAGAASGLDSMQDLLGVVGSRPVPRPLGQ
jgi:hypothetical protein